MALFDGLIDELVTRGNLGAKAAPLLRELVTLITNQPGGVHGFLSRLRTAGFGNFVNDWVGRADAPTLPDAEVEPILGNTVVSDFATRLGLSPAAVTRGIAIALPKVIGRLTEGGVIPTGVPPAVAAFLGHPIEAVEPEAVASAPGGRRRGGMLGLGALVLICAAILWYWFSERAPAPPPPAPAPTAAVTPSPAPVPAPVPPPAPPPAATAEAPPPPAPPAPVAPPPPAAPTAPARLSLSDDNGAATVSGAVPDDATRSSIMDALKSVFGSVSGDLTVDPAAASPPWLSKIGDALAALKLPGLKALFEGNAVSVGGAIAQTDLDRVMNALKSLFGSGFTYAALPINPPDVTQAAANKTMAALSDLKSGYSAEDVVKALNLSIINFPTGASSVPDASSPILLQASAKLKTLPAGVVIEVTGHTDNTGEEAANVQLSQSRADAVRAALIQDGVPAAMLTAKGYGDTQPVATNDTPEGRAQNRRIEYRVVKG